MTITQEQLFANFKEEMNENTEKTELPKINQTQVFQGLRREMKKLDAAYKATLKKKEWTAKVQAFHTKTKGLIIPINLITNEACALMRGQNNPNGYSLSLITGNGKKLSGQDETMLNNADSVLTEKDKQASLFVAEGKPIFSDGLKAVQREEERLYQEQTASASLSVANLGQVPTQEEINQGYK